MKHYPRDVDMVTALGTLTGKVVSSPWDCKHVILEVVISRVPFVGYFS